MKRQYVIGLALGKTAESTGLAVIEVVYTPGTGSPEYHVIYLQSFPPGTDYQLILEQVRKILAECDVIFIVVDQTSVGEPIVRLIKEELGRHVYPVIIGSQHSEHHSTGVDYVPKQTLISEVMAALIRGRLRFSKKLKETPNLTQELLNYENRPTSPASFNADPWREHPSDHLIFAVALACWKLQNPSYFIYDRL